MASLYASNYTNAYRNVPSSKYNAGDFYGRVHVLIDSYTAAGALSSGDVIYFGKIPKGAKVINALLSHDDLGTTGTGKLGWAASAELSAGSAVEAADDDGLIASIDFNTAANIPFAWENVPVPGVAKDFAAEVDVTLTLTAATTAAGSITCMIFFVVD